MSSSRDIACQTLPKTSLSRRLKHLWRSNPDCQPHRRQSGSEWGGQTTQHLETKAGKLIKTWGFHHQFRSVQIARRLRVGSGLEAWEMAAGWERMDKARNGAQAERSGWIQAYMLLPLWMLKMYRCLIKKRVILWKMIKSKFVVLCILEIWLSFNKWTKI